MASSPAHFPIDFPVIDAGEWHLRQLSLGDAHAMLAYLKDPEVTGQTASEFRTIRDVEQLIQFYGHAFARRTDLRWAIVERATGTLVGTCGFSAFNERHARAEVSYDLAREQWGRGVATAVAERVLEYGFETLGLNRIEGVAMTANERPQRVLERLGFTREGVLREFKWSRGAFRDYAVWSLLRREWAERRAPAGVGASAG